MSCKCNGAATSGIQDLSYASLMPRYASIGLPESVVHQMIAKYRGNSLVSTSGLGDDASPTTGEIIGMIGGWLALGGLCGVALFVAGKELLKETRKR